MKGTATNLKLNTRWWIKQTKTQTQTHTHTHTKHTHSQKTHTHTHTAIYISSIIFSILSVVYKPWKQQHIYKIWYMWTNYFQDWFLVDEHEDDMLEWNFKCI